MNLYAAFVVIKNPHWDSLEFPASAVFHGDMRVASNRICKDLEELALYWLSFKVGERIQEDAIIEFKIWELSNPVVDLGEDGHIANQTWRLG